MGVDAFLTRESCRMQWLATPTQSANANGVKRVSYAGLAFLTSDGVADALVDLAAALRRAEIVEVPALDDAGAAQTARLVVGPYSHMIAIPATSPYPEPDLEDAAERLRQQAKRARSQHIATASAPDSTSTGLEELEFP
jgi:hypothetical protein